MPRSVAERSIERLFDALVFNWIILGTDAHAKNYGLLLSGPQRRLAPLYDVSSYLPYDETRGRKVTFAMKVGGDARLHRLDRRVAWERAASELSLAVEPSIRRAAELAHRVPEAFVEAVDEVRGVWPNDFPDRLAGLVADRSKVCSAALQ